MKEIIMEKIKLLVIDDNVNLVNMVTEYFSKTNNIEAKKVLMQPKNKRINMM